MIEKNNVSIYMGAGYTLCVIQGDPRAVTVCAFCGRTEVEGKSPRYDTSLLGGGRCPDCRERNTILGYSVSIGAYIQDNGTNRASVLMSNNFMISFVEGVIGRHVEAPFDMDLENVERDYDNNCYILTDDEIMNLLFALWLADKSSFIKAFNEDRAEGEWNADNGY